MKAVSLRGVAVSPGLAVGRAQVLDREPEESNHTPPGAVSVEDEILRFREALAETEKKVHQVKQSVEKRAGERDAMIFQAQLAILRDPSAQDEVIGRIRNDRVTADVAVHRLMKSFDEKFQGLSDPAVDWASEVRDPWAVVLQTLQQREEKKLLHGKEKLVLVTEELTPSLAMYLQKGRVLAIVSERGGKFSHGGILARSFGIPTIAGVEKATSKIFSGMQVVVNGDDGVVLLEPSQEELDSHRRREREQARRAQALAGQAAEPAETRDGIRIAVGANIESLRDFETFDRSIVDGIGLLRTEFLFRERRELPSEDEQVAIYRQALETMEGKEVTFRTLDVGGDKPLPTIRTPQERNPVLGWRGLRISIEWRDLLIVQLRALLRASVYGPTRILLPMVTSLEEVRLVRGLLDELQRDLTQSGLELPRQVPLGAMIEVPSSVYLLPHLGQEVQFVSVGTNDLVQYLLAVDRDNPWVASLYEPFHPALVAVVDQIANLARPQALEVAVCGEMAGDPQAALLFLAVGIRHLSMAPHFVPAVKAILRQCDSRTLADLRGQLLSLGTAAEVRELLAERTAQLWKAFLSPT